MTQRDIVNVALASRSYDILIGSNLLTEAADRISNCLRRPFAVIVTDDNVAKLHLNPLETALAKLGVATKSITLPAGEKTKSFASLAKLCDDLLASGLERRDSVLALGGGVIGDLTGFAAAIVRRGVNFIQVPTTLLAQVDSSVGGKTGINSVHGKNLVGAFYQPSLVIADLTVLETLPQRQRCAGYAEVVKYGLLGDKPFYDWLHVNALDVVGCKHDAARHAVRTSCEAKARIVAADETETGVRALLNLGHTFGHAYEAATGYTDALLHGEAVAIGMIQAFRFSEFLGHCQAGTADTVASHIASTGLPTHVSRIKSKLPDIDTLIDIMHQDKKATLGKLTFILVRSIGDAFVAPNIDVKKLREFLLRDNDRK